MNISLFIARRLYRDKTEKKPVTTLAVRIATLGIGIGLAVMIISLCIVLGFQNEITEKVTGFGSHIEVINPCSANSPESFAISGSDEIIKQYQQIENIKHIQRISNKFGILKTNSDYKGIILKGIDASYDTTFVKKYLVSGNIPFWEDSLNSQEIIISKTVAADLKVKQNDKLFAYFFENTVKVRRFHVAGIFSTGMEQFDKHIVFTNRHSVNQLNSWPDSLCSTLEIQLQDFNRLAETQSAVIRLAQTIKNPDQSYSVAFTVKQLYSQIFDWLKLLDLNIWVILALMTLLSCLTIISGLLILILEKTSTIGILKALGTKNGSIRKIFIYYAVFIIGRGIALGYILGLGICFLQKWLGIVRLDPDKYYVSDVPILFHWPLLILLGVGTLIISIITLIGPSYLVSHIRPAKAIRFE